MNTAINLMKKNSHDEPQVKNADMLWAEQIGHLFRESQMKKLRSCSTWKYRAGLSAIGFKDLGLTFNSLNNTCTIPNSYHLHISMVTVRVQRQMTTNR